MTKPPRYIVVVTYNNNRQSRVRFPTRHEADAYGKKEEARKDVQSVFQDRAY